LKRDLFLGLLDEAGFTYTVPQGAYYVLVDCSPFKVTDDLEFCYWLSKEIGVAAVPGSSFFQDAPHSLIRFQYARRDEVLLEAGKRLKEIKEKWKA
jgi:aminotransferase